MRVKGKLEGVAIFEPIGPEGEVGETDARGHRPLPQGARVLPQAALGRRRDSS